MVAKSIDNGYVPELFLPVSKCYAVRAVLHI